jgi:hypothetical protein
MQPMYYIGLDVHKRKITTSLSMATRAVVGEYCSGWSSWPGHGDRNSHSEKKC